MTKKCLIAIFTLEVTIVISFVVIAFVEERRPSVTKANYGRIELGMTCDDVNALFGTPEFALGELGEPSMMITWWGRDGCARIQFDAAGKVSIKHWDDYNHSALEKLERLLPGRRLEKTWPPGVYF